MAIAGRVEAQVTGRVYSEGGVATANARGRGNARLQAASATNAAWAEGRNTAATNFPTAISEGNAIARNHRTAVSPIALVPRRRERTPVGAMNAREGVVEAALAAGPAEYEGRSTRITGGDWNLPGTQPRKMPSFEGLPGSGVDGITPGHGGWGQGISHPRDVTEGTNLHPQPGGVREMPENDWFFGMRDSSGKPMFNPLCTGAGVMNGGADANGAVTGAGAGAGGLAGSELGRRATPAPGRRGAGQARRSSRFCVARLGLLRRFTGTPPPPGPAPD